MFKRRAADAGGVKAWRTALNVVHNAIFAPSHSQAKSRTARHAAPEKSGVVPPHSDTRYVGGGVSTGRRGRLIGQGEDAEVAVGGGAVELQEVSEQAADALAGGGVGWGIGGEVLEVVIEVEGVDRCELGG